MLRSFNVAASLTLRSSPLLTTPALMPAGGAGLLARSFGSRASGSGSARREGRVRWGRVILGATLIFAGYRIGERMSQSGDERDSAMRVMRERERMMARRDPDNRPTHAASHAQQQGHGEEVKRYHGIDASLDAATSQPTKSVAQQKQQKDTTDATTPTSAPAAAPLATVASAVAATASSAATAVAAPVKALVAAVKDETHEKRDAPSNEAQTPASSTLASSSAPADSGVTRDEADDDDDDETDEEIAAWARMRAEEERSAPANAHPDRPAVSSLVAAQIPSRIDARTDDVLLQVYAPWCGACKMLNPIVDTVSDVVKQAQAGSARHMQVMAMDGDANVLPGFLSEEESRALPLVKFFPRCGAKHFSAEVRAQPACRPMLYDGQPSVERMLAFVHRRMRAQEEVLAAAPTPAFDLAAAHSLGRAAEPATQSRVHAALVRRFEQDMEDQPAIRVFELAPCGPLMTTVMQNFMQAGYRSYTDAATMEAEGHALFTAYRECCEKSEERIEDFWQQVKRQVDDALAASQERKQTQAGAQGNKEKQ